MKVYVFDVDGVLCDTGEKINPAFANWFLGWSKKQKYYIVTGSSREKTIDQIGEQIVNNASMSFHCLGNSIWINEEEILVNQFDLKTEELNFLNRLIDLCNYNFKTGNHIEQRSGSVNVSFLGHGAPKEERLNFKKWDDANRYRDTVIKTFVKKYPRFDAFKGGMTSIDICLRGADKSQCISLINYSNKPIIFFGDKTKEENEIDYPLAILREIHTVYQIDNGYKETWDILKNK